MKRQEHLEQLNTLDDVVLERLATLSKEKKAIAYFKNSFKFGILTTFLKNS